MGSTTAVNRGWSMAWAEPATVALSVDHSARPSLAIRQGETGVVQVTLGEETRVDLETASGFRTYSGGDLPSALVDGVLSLRPTPADAAEAPPEAPADVESLVAPEPLVEPESLVAPEPEADFDETVLTPRPPALQAQPEADFDATVLTPRRNAPPEPDFDETVFSPRIPPFLAPAAAPSTAAPGPAFEVLVADVTGARLFPIDGALYIGRSPAVPAERGAREGALAFVGSRTEHVSATHLVLVDDDGLLLVRDLWSTNGTELTPPAGPTYRLTPGESLPLAVGTRLSLADDVTIEVVEVGPAASHLSSTAQGHRAE